MAFTFIRHARNVPYLNVLIVFKINDNMLGSAAVLVVQWKPIYRNPYI